ncbi:peptide MFS transporter [Bacteroidia bacterium]|nr:peptide MFS transporter [Bacteroidia bacterium]
MAKTKHPKALPYLFLTEMWERFGYYLMLGIFSLYMLDSWNNGGMGFDSVKKSDIYGTYLGLVYLTPFLGGLLADRVFGYRKSIIFGGLLMAAGYLTLSIHSNQTFYIALALIIVGNGFFKPNISTLLGNLYNKDEFKANKDAGYNIFYMGINIGAFVCNFVAAYMRNNWGWNWAFIVAGIGMLVGVATFIAGSKTVKDADVIRPLEDGDMSTGRILGFTLLPMIIFGVIGYFFGGVTSPTNPDGNFLGTDTNDAFIFGCLPVVAFFIYLYAKANSNDKRPIGALLAVFACLVIFWAVFHQNGDALTEWAENNTDREMPLSVSNTADKIGMTQTVRDWPLNQAPEAEIDAKLEALQVEKKAAQAAGDRIKTKEVVQEMNIVSKSPEYFKNLEADKRPGTGKTLKLYSTELYQSINPFWVVLLTPILVGFWGFLRKKGKEPSTPTKIAIGLLITALSALVMVGAVHASNNLGTKASSWWLIASYGVITIGELCLSPMGLSLVSKLSPPRITALMMGGFFLSTAIGNKLSGMLSGMWGSFENKQNFFYMNMGLALVAALMMFALLRWLNGVMKEKNID